MPPDAKVPVELDKERTLRYRMRAMEAIENKTGKNIMADWQGFFEGLSATEWITVIWAGLLHEDPEVGRDVVLDHVDMTDVPELSIKALKAMGVDPDEAEATVEGDADPKKGTDVADPEQ